MDDRRCEICGSVQFEDLHDQNFYVNDEVKPLSYSVVACENCGFVFATNIPSQKQYESYYNENTKYTYDEGVIPDDLKKLHQNSFALIDNHLQGKNNGNRKECKIIDIGCSTGSLLGVFKSNGYSDLIGLEPSEECCKIAESECDVKVMPCSLQQYESENKYDIAILTGVLEHIRDLSDNLAMVSSFLKDNGLLYVVVPDADNFSPDPQEPFHEFSIEHINFFTAKSLSNLVGKHGYKRVYSESVPVKLYDSQALMSLWIKTNDNISIEKDVSGSQKVEEYISRSTTKQRPLRDLIKNLVDSQEELVVWGVGSLTSRLLMNTDLGQANISNFVDSNKGLHGKKIKGIEVAAPQVLKGKDLTVLISSSVYGKEIKNILSQDYNYKGKVILVEQ